jgi:DNA-binding SARP family transcriptional activator
VKGERRGLLLFNSSSWKLPKSWRSYLKERCEQKQHLKKQSSRLEVLLKTDSIDKDTYERLMKLLDRGYEQKRQEIRLKYGFA